jgi:inosine-uridine nucleoside N-ribohydrolase
VIMAMSRAYENSAGSISDRLMAALVAGDRAGGDHRGRLAAGIRAARPDHPGNWLELDVDDSNDAVAELAGKYAALEHAAKAASPAAAGAARDDRVRLIFDTDMGNDIDDALALGVIHALQSRGECELLAVTLSKDNEFAAPFVDLVNTFYGRSRVPVGAVRAGKTPEVGKYIRLPCEARAENGQLRYPHRLLSGKDAPEAVGLLRRTLAAQPDGSVVIAVVGFSTNLARLLDSQADAHSPLPGRELVAKKCRLLAMMAGMFGGEKLQKEYNVYIDLPAAKKVFADWPTPLVASGFEIGQAIKYPASSIERDFRYVPQHPLREAYELYMKMPYDRETWDLTAVLYAIRPAHGYFGQSQPGTIRVDEREITQFTPSENGRQRFLTVTPEQIVRVKEALVQLASQPPGAVRAE